MASNSETAGGVEAIVSELHERGVRTARAEAERILAAARRAAEDVAREAAVERERVIEEANREAQRIEAAAREQARQLLQSFMDSLPEVFSRRASRMLERLLSEAFDPGQPSETIERFLQALVGEREARLRTAVAEAAPRSFLEGLVLFALAFYAERDDLARFTVDAGLQRAWARLVADPALAPEVPFEFRDGIGAFTVRGRNGREVVVSPESIRHMAECWASEEFRQVFLELDTSPPAAGSAG